MQAIILAAGMGKRLGELTQENTKCMVKVNGTRLIGRLLAQLAAYNLDRVVLVIGYEGEKLRHYLGDEYRGMKLCYVENPIYDKTNNIYSLYLAKDFLQEDDSLLLESDIIFDSAILDRLVRHPYPNLAVVDKYESWMDGTMVTLDQDENIVSFVPKKAFNYNEVDSYYKTVNIYKFSRAFSSQLYVPFLEAYCRAMGRNEYYEQVLRVLAMLDKTGIKAMRLQGEPWYEIDDVQDLDIAEAMFVSDDQKLEMYQKRYGGYWRFPAMLDYCYLVNPFFPTQKMKAELRSMFDVLLTEYPSGMRVNSFLAARYFGIHPEYVCVGNGAAELIKSLMNSLPGNIGMVFPTFEEYPNRRNGSEVVRYLPQNPDFAYTADDLMAFFADKQVATLLLINPDNPSGNFIPKADILRLCQWTAERHIRFIVDESFVDFADGDDNSLLHNALLKNNPHLIVVKSISKSYGVPGLRLGVVASSDDALIGRMRADVSIWNINSFGEYYMQIYGKYEKDYAEACRQFRKERAHFGRLLQNIPYLRVIPSQANYFLCEVINTYTSKELTEKLLNHYNILIKDCGHKQAFERGQYIRLAVRNQTDNFYLVKSLTKLIR